MLHAVRWAALAGGVVLMLIAGQQWLLFGRHWNGILLGMAGAGATYWGCSSARCT